MPQEIPSVQIPDKTINRWASIVTEAVNRILRFGMPIQVYTSSARPSPSSSWAGKFIRVKDTGQPEQLQVCLQKSNSGDFAWVTVAISP